jgi:putative oxidoreductase
MTEDPSALALRLTCAAFFIPHALAKIRHPEGSMPLFSATGLRPARFWVAVAAGLEIGVASCLALDIWTRLAAGLGSAFLIAAAAVVMKESRGKWRWNTGGAEYPVFWGLCCGVVALQG